MVRCAALLAILIASGTAGAGEPILAQMSGIWIGEGLTLMLDGERMQGNLDESLPFQREPLLLKNIAGTMVVFQVGKRHFIGSFNQDELNLTGDGLSGSTILRRSPARVSRR